MLASSTERVSLAVSWWDNYHDHRRQAINYHNERHLANECLTTQIIICTSWLEEASHSKHKSGTDAQSLQLKCDLIEQIWRLKCDPDTPCNIVCSL